MPSKTSHRDLQTVLQRAIDLFHEGKTAAAISLLQTASKRFRDSAKLWGYLGFLQKEKNLINDAIVSFQHAVNLAPSSEKASLGLFFSLYHARRSEDAFDEMLRFMKRGDSELYLNMFRNVSFQGHALGPLPGSELEAAERTFLEVARSEQVAVPFTGPQQLLELVDA
jgi:hypothetical protein